MRQYSIFVFLGYILCGFSSALLGIWAVKDTIALRNILLGSGAFLSAIYIFFIYIHQSFRPASKFKACLPLGMLSLMFGWILMHYFFLSRYPGIQLGELQSTWLRSFLASILGFGTALAVFRKPMSIYLLWAGIFLSFMVLFYQYIPRAIANNTLSPWIDFYGPSSYIYIGKINAVLMGLILISGLSCSLVGYFILTEEAQLNLSLIGNIFLICYGVIGVISVFYSYALIFNARTGVGLLLLVLGINLTLIGIWISRSFFSKSRGHYLKKSVAGLIICVLLIAISSSGYKHYEKNIEWRNLIEDVELASNIDLYQNWADIRSMGYPTHPSGRPIAANTYERVSWFLAGARLLLQNPLGVGILNGPFPLLLADKYPNLTAPSTHSGWVELGLAFGLPILGLIFGLLAVLIFRAQSIMSLKKRFAFLCLIFPMMIFILYLLGELSTGHSVEILFYWLAWLVGIDLSRSLVPSVGASELARHV